MSVAPQIPSQYITDNYDNNNYYFANYPSKEAFVKAGK